MSELEGPPLEPKTDQDYWPPWLIELSDERSTCKYCNSTIRWGKTKNGKNVPMDLAPNARNQLESHFGSCPERKR